MTIAGRYEPTGSTDAGGMGEIIECNDLHLQRRVIVKSLQVEVEERRLIDEQKALVRLRSKHVVQLYDIVQVPTRKGARKALVLEYIEGKNLELGAFVPNREYLHILWQIASGLADIHAAGVIHRDIKPNNIRLDNEGIIKIFDFGLARSNDDAKTRSIIGTPMFMAPELWQSETVSFDRSIDIYAFGVTCVALLHDRAPRELACQPPQPISLANLQANLGGLQPDIVALIHSCLSGAPSHRPTMEIIQSKLARYLLENNHRALVVMNGQTHLLDKKNRKITLRAGTIGSLTVEYDGFDFKVTNVSGAVFFNNTAVQMGGVVPGCCVITFGAGSNRFFVTFDVSHPEVMP